MKKNIEQAIIFCKEAGKVNLAINETGRLYDQMMKALNSFYEDEVNSPALFSKEVNFQIQSSYGCDCNFENSMVNKLEIRPSLSSCDGLFYFSLMLILVLENKESLCFRIAINNKSNFYLVQCKDIDACVIEAGDGVCAKFSLKDNLMETLTFCYESIDSFNENLDIKLLEHLYYACQTPLNRIKKDSLQSVNCLLTGMSVGIFNDKLMLGKAVVAMIEDTPPGLYPVMKIIRVVSFDKYFPKKNYAFVAIAGNNNQEEGWYHEYDVNGVVYQIKPL